MISYTISMLQISLGKTSKDNSLIALESYGMKIHVTPKFHFWVNIIGIGGKMPSKDVQIMGALT